MSRFSITTTCGTAFLVTGRHSVTTLKSDEFCNSLLDFLRLGAVPKLGDRLSGTIEHEAAVKVPHDAARELGLGDADNGVRVVTIDNGALGDDEFVSASQCEHLDVLGRPILLPAERVARDGHGDEVGGGKFGRESVE